MVVLLLPAGARATTWRAAPGQLATIVARAAAGDTVVAARGTHPGPIVVRSRLILTGEPGAVVHGGGKGSVIVVLAAGTLVEGLEVRSGGADRQGIDAGVRVSIADHVRLRRLKVRDTLYGIYGERSNDLRITDCDLVGRVQELSEDGPVSMEGDGNGVHLWTCTSARIEDTQVTRFTDGVYLSFTHGARLERDLLHENKRYGLHTMYCQEGILRRTRFTRNTAGCAIMFSNHLIVEDNAFVHNRGSRTYGLLLRDCSDGRFARNQVVDNTIGFFMDNSNRNRFVDHRIEDNGWGVLLFASCADNVFAGNDFIQNDHPVALDMRRTRNAFDDGVRGNYWSEHAAWDLDADGRGDAPYSPVSAFAFLSKQYPDLTLLTHSPAVAALSGAEKVLPALHPSEAVDRIPATAPIAVLEDVAAADVQTEGGEARRDRRGWSGAALFAGVALLGVSALALGGRT